MACTDDELAQWMQIAKNSPVPPLGVVKLSDCSFSGFGTERGTAVKAGQITQALVSLVVGSSSPLAALGVAFVNQQIAQGKSEANASTAAKMDAYQRSILTKRADGSWVMKPNSTSAVQPVPMTPAGSTGQGSATSFLTTARSLARSFPQAAQLTNRQWLLSEVSALLPGLQFLR